MNDDGGPANILLQGPEKSGRTSLAMDMALEFAAKAKCECHSRVCKCLPVVFLRPDCKAESFPMRCQRHGKRQEEEEVLDRIQRLKAPTSSSNLWEKKLLRKIHVHHFVSFRDCLQCLLSLQGKPKHEQPYRAIVVDDIDWLADESLGAKESPMQVSQFLAILFDTVNFLVSRPTVCVTMSTKSHFPMDCYMASFFDSVVTSHEKTSDQASWNKACQEHNLTAHSCWTVGVHHLHQEGSSPDNVSTRKRLDYLVSHNGNEDYQILWRALDP